MPPENRNDSSAGSPITMSAPRSPRRMSLIPWRMFVPGAMRRSASSIFGSVRTSTRGSLMAVIRSGQCEPDRSTQGISAANRERARARGAGGCDDLGDAQLGRLGEAGSGVADGAQAAGEPDLAEARQPLAGRPAAVRRDDREGDGEVGRRLVDAHASGNVHEDI